MLLLVIFLGFDLSHQPVLSQLKDRHPLFGFYRAWMVLCALIDRLSRSVKSGKLESLLMNNVLFDIDLVHLFQVLEVLLPLLLLDKVVDLLLLELPQMPESLVVVEEFLVSVLISITLFLEEPLKVVVHVFLGQRVRTFPCRSSLVATV